MSQQPSLRTKIGQLFSVGIQGLSPSVETLKLLQEYHIGGVILFHRNIESLEQVCEMNRRLFEVGTDSHPVLMSVDQEGGRVARLRDICVNFPPMRMLAACSTADEMYRAGALMGRELSALGFHMDHAPVLDVDSNPNNPVIGDRAFGKTAQEVIDKAIPFGKGLQASGIAAVGKHFPGHGDTETDSHVTLPKLNNPRSDLERIEWPPFVAAKDAGFAAYMTAHIILESLDPNHPATCSKQILQDLLRAELGFEGLIISDDLDMKAISQTWSTSEAAIRSIQAGCDHLLVCHSLEAVPDAIDAIEAAIHAGEISEDRVQDAYQRTLDIKHRFIGQRAPPDLVYAQSLVKCPAHLELAQRWMTLLPEAAKQVHSPLLEAT